MPFISDSNLNKFAIDTTGYAKTTNQLIGFIRGKRIQVTYYRLLNREGNNVRSNVMDMANARNITESEYQKIIGLEITLPKAFEFTSNSEQANVQITGQAMFYPNMNPNVGDHFLVNIGDGRIGMCRVSRVEPTTWRTDRIYLINFVVLEFLEHLVSEPLEAATTQVSYFSKTNYLGGTAALLAEQTYLQLAKIKEERIILCKLFHQAFFDRGINSYLRPDGIYDPWVVRFMCGKLRMEDVFQRPRNLLGQVQDQYARTLWGRLEDENNNTLFMLDPCQQLRGYEQDRMSVFVSELYNRRIVYTAPKSTALDSYLYSDKFYTEDADHMSTEELLVYEAITKKTSGGLTSLILDHIDPVFKLTPDRQFYKIPLCIHLIDMSLRSQYREIDAPGMGYAQSGDD